MTRTSVRTPVRLMSSAAMLTVLALCSGQAGAQENGAAADGQATQLQEVVVDGGEGGGTGPVEGYVAKDTTAGSKTDTPIQDIPQSVSVVGRDEIDDRGAQQADEALRYTAGVLAQPFGPDSDTNWFFIRGFQATQTGTYMDGLQLQSYSFGGFYVDSFLLERIEVLKGPASVLYGGSNPGGIVNYVSKRPTSDSFNNFEAGIDSFGRGYVGFDIDGAGGPSPSPKDPQSPVDYRVTGRIYGGDGYTDYADQLLGVISPSLTISPDEATTLTILANYTHLDKTHEGGSFLPYYGTVEDAFFGKIDREFNYTEPDIDRYDREQASVGYEFEHEFDNGWTVRQNTRYGFATIEEAAVYPFGYAGFLPQPAGDDASLARINFGHGTEINNVLVDTQIEGKVVTGAVEHTLLGGIDYKYFGIDQLQASISTFSPTGATTLDPTDPDYGRPQGSRVAYLDEEYQQNQIGVYVQDQLRFGGGWLVTLNGRYDEYWGDRDDRLAADDDYDTSDGQASGRAGLAYEFANGLTPYASVATFFLPLIGTNSETGSAQEAEEGEQYEVGLKYVPTTFDGLFTVSLFDLTRQNVAVTNPVTFLQSQIGEQRSQGVEFEAKASITGNIDAVASFTYQDVEITEDANEAIVGNTPYLVPDVLASLFLNYTFHDGALDGVSVGAGVRYTGESQVNFANTLQVPDSTVADARIGYKKDNWGVDLTVTNLFDKKYVASCQTEFTCSYGEARKALLKANFSW